MSRSGLRKFLLKLAKDKAAAFGLAVIMITIMVAISADFLAPYDPTDQNLPMRRTPPSSDHFFGTDEFGRDIFSRILYGSRYTLMVGLISVGIGGGIGVILGVIAGYRGGVLGNIIMRSVDAMLAFPYFLIAIVIVAIIGPGLRNAMIAIGISTIPRYVRVTNGSVLSVKENDYIRASQSIGASDLRIVLKHVLPNILAPIIILSTVGMAGAILSAAGLSFLGLGAQPPTPEWGVMLGSGRVYLREAPHIVLFPGISIMVVVLAFNLFGDGLRDWLDPRLKI
jgi:peptide/nickel transport system permease protein